jgi:pyruvate-formate lyase-activating enzyme
MRLANQGEIDFSHAQEAMRQLEKKIPKYIKHRWKGSTLFIEGTSLQCPFCNVDIRGTHVHQITQGDLKKYDKGTK